MPKKDFIVTVTMKGGKDTKVAFADSSVYPDLSKRYLLTYTRNALGKNTMTIGINEKGLLTTATAETTSGISEALKNLAASAGTIGAMGSGLRDAQIDEPVCPDGDSVFVVRIDADTTTQKLCSARVSFKRLDGGSSVSTAVEANKAVAGIYYRQNEPYLAEAIGSSGKTSAILFSPSRSPTYLLPISPTVFAHNKAEFGFTEGMPTKYNQDADGEVIALLKLPADVIAAYFAAIGATFDSFKSTDTKEKDALEAATKLSLARQKYEACVAAINAKDAAVIAKLGC